MRCLTLADALSLRGVRSVFFSRTLSGGLTALLSESGHEICMLPQTGPVPDVSAGQYGAWLGTTEAHDAAEMCDALARFSGHRFLTVIVDHYGLQGVWERAVRSCSGLPIIALDDLGRSHEADLLLDPTHGKTADDYRGLVPDHCLRLVGSDYALLRPEFQNARQASLLRRSVMYPQDQPVRTLLVAMGGADPDDALGFLLPELLGLARTAGFVVHALVGPAYAQSERIATMVRTYPERLVLHRNIRDVAALLVEMDLCIGASGSSTWERCCLGVPTVNIVIADNQRQIDALLSSRGILISGGEYPGASPDGVSISGLTAAQWIERRLRPVLEDCSLLRRLSAAAAEVVDGAGTTRVVEAVFAFLPDALPTELVPITRDDAELVFQWQSFPGLRTHFRNPEPPTWADHVAWLDRRLRDGASQTLIITLGRIPAGLVQLDRDASGVGTEISILVAPELQGRGVARRATRSVLEYLPGRRIIAHVRPENLASRRLFLACGFVERIPGEFRHEGAAV